MHESGKTMGQWMRRLHRLLVPVMMLGAAMPLIAADHFVTRSGTHLMLEGKPFRFAGGNLDYLALAADSFGKVGATDIYYPSHEMIDDAFATLNKMNGTVARVWSSASQGCALCVEPDLGKFNETALRQLDYVVYSAGKHHVRVVLLFVDPWGYYTGGIAQYKKWRGGGDFFRDPKLIADYKLYVSTLINRKNTFNGVHYKDDPAILAWEAGNELREAPIEWEREIAHYIKSLDRNHLLISSNDVHGVEPARAAIPEIDVLSRHYYPRFQGFEWSLDHDSAAAKQAGKVLVVDEFGWDASNSTIDQFKENLNAILGDTNIGGDLFWALRGHKDNGEYMAVPGAEGDWWALYYPGRKTPLNEEDDMRQRVRILSDHAAAMTGNVPSVAPAAKVTGFVTPSGTHLMLEGKPFRFAGGNLDYLALASDSFGKVGATDIYYPSHEMIDDAFATLKKMNGTVARVWSSGSQGCALCVEPSLGKFNETALRQLDYVVYSAGKHHVRVSIPGAFTLGASSNIRTGAVAEISSAIRS